MEPSKNGKEFEDLATWINRCLHDRAVITPNDKIRDVHTGKLRQIDISIRLNDGPTKFLGIVEVRDRSRPADQSYIEEISAKRQSVGADAAFIISSSGFYEAAIQKAKALNIRVFTYKEAVSSDWTQCLQLTQITQFLRRWNNVMVLLLEPSTGQIFNPHKSFIEAVQKNANAPVFVNEKDESKSSILELARLVIDQNADNFFGSTPVGSPPQRKGARVTLQVAQNESALFFRDATGALNKLELFYLEADFWTEIRQIPVVLSKYCDAETGNAIAEVASTTLEVWGGLHKVDLIAKFLGENGKEGSQLLMRMQKQESPKLNPNSESPQ